MPSQIINLQNLGNRVANVFYLCKGKTISECRELYYLQSVRSGSGHRVSENPSLKQRYENRLPYYKSDLAGLLNNKSFDAIIKAPSSRQDADPYFEAIKDVIDCPDDLSTYFRRELGARSSPGVIFTEFVKKLIFSPECSLNYIGNLLIVDDIIASFTTVESIIYHLLEKGALDDNSSINIAVPLWLSAD